MQIEIKKKSSPTVLIVEDHFVERAVRLEIRKKSRPTVLIVEDNFLTARLLVASVHLAGHPSVTARNGDEAEQMIERHRPDILMINMNLCRPSGLELLRTLQIKRAGLRVIAFMAPGQSDLRSAAFGLGAMNFFETPFHPIELARQLSQMSAQVVR